ncbi:unnamed protein product, partial [Symbiodinium sp. KB8]
MLGLRSSRNLMLASRKFRVWMSFFRACFSLQRDGLMGSLPALLHGTKVLGTWPSAMDGDSALQQQPLPVLSESPSGSQHHQEQQDPAGDQADEQVERQARAAIAELLPGVDLQTLSLYDFHCSVSTHLGWGRRGLEAHAQSVSGWIKEAVEAHVAKSQQSPQQLFNAVLKDLGDEDTSKKLRVHMLTFSRISRLLPATIEAGDLRNVSEMSREAVADCVWKAFDNPVQGPSRPCARAQGLVTKLVVFREFHQDGDYHFHVAVLLRQPRTFAAAKKTLRERDRLAARFACSHTQFWSAVRYGFLWTMRPFHGVRLVAGVHSTSLPSCNGLGRQTCGRNASEKMVSAGLAKKQRCFSKLDLTAIILEKGLTSKAALLAYVQDHGTEEMQPEETQGAAGLYIPLGKLQQLRVDLLALGVVHVRELTEE